MKTYYTPLSKGHFVLIAFLVFFSGLSLAKKNNQTTKVSPEIVSVEEKFKTLIKNEEFDNAHELLLKKDAVFSKKFNSKNEWETTKNKLLSELYRAQGDLATAIKYSRLYREALKPFYIKESTDLLDGLEAQFQTKAKQRKVNELKTLELPEKRRLGILNRWVAGSWLLAILLLGYAILLYFQKKKITAAHHVLFEKNKAIAEAELPVSNTPPSNSERYKDSALDNEELQAIMQKVDFIVHEKKGYRKKNFSLETLAKSVGADTKLVSQAINMLKNKNYSTYINEKRILEAMHILEETPEASFEEISKRVGFKTVATFRNSFKKYTGLTPIYYKDNVKQFSKSNVA